MLDIKGKIALITGGASGIGLACADELLKNGCKGVTIVDVNEEKAILEKSNLISKYGQGKVVFVKADVAKKIELEEAFKRTIDTFKNLDIVFNNAGLIHEIDYEACLNVNFVGVVHCLKLAIEKYLPKYKTGQEAVIVNTSSFAGLTPCIGVEIYSTTKMGVIGLTRNFGVDFHYQRTGVRVIGICPDATDTAIISNFLPKLVYKELEPMFNEASKVENRQTPEELAKICMKLVQNSENGSVWYIKMGEVIEVDFPDLLNGLTHVPKSQ